MFWNKQKAIGIVMESHKVIIKMKQTKIVL